MVSAMHEKRLSRANRHHSFILTLWSESDDLVEGRPAWRFSLQDPHSLERHGFADLYELVSYLEAWLAAPPEETLLGN